MTRREYDAKKRVANNGINRTRYTVYDNSTDFPIIVCGTAQECAARIGISVATFYVHKHSQKVGSYAPYHIITERGCDW